MTKMDKEMIKKVENSLWQQVYGTIYSLISMSIMIRKTCAEIKTSETYRESDKLRLSIKEVEEHIEESESYIKPYNVPINVLRDLVRSQESYFSALRDLKNGRILIDFAKRELDMTLSQIDAHSQSIQERRNNHVGGIINNTMRLVGNGVQYLQTPAAILTTTALSLYGVITGMNVVTITGHAAGIYWSQEELNKLNDLKHQMDKVQDNIKNIFSTIQLIEQKLAKIKTEE